MPPSIASYDGKTLRKNIDNFPFAFVAPLGADDYRSLASFQKKLRDRNLRTHRCAARMREHRGSHTTCPAANMQKDLWDKSGEDVYGLSYRGGVGDGNEWSSKRAASCVFVHASTFLASSARSHLPSRFLLNFNQEFNTHYELGIAPM